MAPNPKSTLLLMIKPFGKSSRWSPYYHRALQPSDSPCSNTYLLSLSYPVLPSCIPSSMKISDSRIKLLGHILRHPSSSESLICFNQSYSLRTISSPFRRGAPRAHWPELALAQASHRAYILHEAPPHTWGFPAFFLSTFHYRWAKTLFPPPAWNSGTIPGGIFTSSCQLQKTEIDGSCFTPKWNSQPSWGTMLLRKCRPMWTTYRLWKNLIWWFKCLYLAIFLSIFRFSIYLSTYLYYIYIYPKHS